MIPCFLKRLLISILIRNQANKIIPRKESVPLLQTPSLIRNRKRIYRQEIHCVLHATMIIFWIHGKSWWKRLWRKEPNSWPTKNYAMVATNLSPVTTISKPASKDCFAGSAKSTIQQEYMIVSRNFLKKILSPKIGLKIQ